MLSVLFDSVSRGLEAALSLYARRHEVLASNLANVETPGYRAHELDFREALRAAFEPPTEAPPGPKPPPGGGAAAAARIVEDRSAPARPDGGTVDLDTQMAKLAENGLRYVVMGKLLDRRLALIRHAIEGR